MKQIHDLDTFERAEGITLEDVHRNPTKLPGHGEIELHMIFDVKMNELFTRKARLITNENETPELPNYEQCASVVSRESVWIVFFYDAALNDFDKFSCDISNAYLGSKSYGQRQGQSLDRIKDE
mmetsp:Transcript_1999/g.2719  ORF Transcript_1999/g.2719 Transcript_1999/m.2719 type:complete len:124 (+) Transcript_1999:3622-3993(+)